MNQINFYQDEFKPKVVVFDAYQMLYVTVAFTALVLIYHLISSSGLGDEQAKLNQAMQSLNEMQTQSNDVEQEILQYGEQPAMLAKLDTLQKQLKQQQAILNHLGNDNLAPQHGFSATLESLSHSRIDNVWLGNFSLRNGGQSITIQGYSRSTELIPEYIDSLAQSKTFGGQQFSVFQMSNPSNSDTYEFELHTQNEAQ